MDEQLRRQTLLSNIIGNIGAMGRNQAPTSVAEALMGAQMDERNMQKSKLQDTLATRQEDRLQNNQTFLQKEAKRKQDEDAAAKAQSLATQLQIQQAIAPYRGDIEKSMQVVSQFPPSPEKDAWMKRATEARGKTVKFKEGGQEVTLQPNLVGGMDELARGNSSGQTINVGGSNPLAKVTLATDTALVDPNDPSKGVYVIPESELARTRKNEAAAAEKQLGRDKTAWGDAMFSSNVAMDTIQRLAKKNNALTQGIGGTVLKLLPGTSANDVEAMTKTLTSKQTLDTLKMAKEQSKTGATGFGQLSEKELDLLIAAVSNLSQSTSIEEKMHWLNVSYQYFGRFQAGLKTAGDKAGWEYEEPAQLPGYNGTPAAATGSTASGVDALLEKYK